MQDERRWKMPERIQLKRTKGWRMPENTVKVARPSKWGNPFKIGATDVQIGTMVFFGPVTRQDAVTFYKAGADTLRKQQPDYFEELRGKNLACFCPLDEPCHVDVLLELANA